MLQRRDAESKTIAVGYIEGDGVGPEITRAALAVVNAACSLFGDGREIAWQELLAGEKGYRSTGQWLPNNTLYEIEDLGMVLKGPLSTPVGQGIRSITVQMRKSLDLYACVRPIRYYPGVPTPVKHPERVDMVVFRENTEDVYAGIEWESQSEVANQLTAYLSQLGASMPNDAAIGIKVMTPQGSQRLIRAAIQYALKEERKSVTLMHKGNIMKFTEGAFRAWGYQLASQEFEGLTVAEKVLVNDGFGDMTNRVIIKDRIADNLFQQVLTNPQDYDVIAAPNLNGDYLSDALAAQIGGLGMAPGANMSDSIGMFEATHGTAPKYAGQDRMNPCSLILSAVMLLRHVNWSDIADIIEAGIMRAIASKRVTYDLARGVPDAVVISTTEFTESIIQGMTDYLDSIA